MTRRRNPYEALGVAADASTDDIRSAYRRKAKATHPDHGGDAAAFDEVTKAYDLLTDPQRRLTYDETGVFEEQAVDPDAAATALIRHLVDQLAEQIGDEVFEDIVTHMRRHLEEVAGKIRQSIKKDARKAGRIEALAERFNRSAGDNFIRAHLAFKAKAIRQQVKAGEAEIVKIQRAKELLADFTFTTDVRPEPEMFLYRAAAGSSWFGGSSTA
jgi:curved DNA-binding protein CbpA